MCVAINTATGTYDLSASATCRPVCRSLLPLAFASASAPPRPVIILPLPTKGCRRKSARDRDTMVMMGQLGRLVDGIKSRLRAGGAGKRGVGGSVRKASASASAAGYDKVEKTDSMRVEIRSRQARKLIAKNLDAADSIARANKRFFLAF
ncbi:hypothetical protein C2845_PM13G12600 [Panicum miliaceum]|uniref:Uncharacterized protein n=1 Tax=Panicum miliaceum TaxID=4540 RepID=A0A3L6RMZ1_PANMI|nr:hypothetical protein C2845_PM13G12600 [Panicum miliaceum]